MARQRNAIQMVFSRWADSGLRRYADRDVLYPKIE